jgi:uncharacterized phage protein (TIGR02216 family)
LITSSCPASCRASTSCLATKTKNLDGRDKPGHDELTSRPKSQPKPKPFPWREAIGFGLGVLRLSPENFWRMTPRELALALEARLGRTPTTFARERFAELMKRYPDGR